MEPVRTDLLESEEWSDEWVQDCATWHGRVLTGRLAHWCSDWDGLPMDETCQEIDDPMALVCPWCGFAGEDVKES